MKRSVHFYVAAVVATSAIATAAAAFLCDPVTSADWRTGLVFSLFGLAGLILSYQRSASNASGSISFLPYLSAVLISPTLAAPVCVYVSSLIGQILIKRPVVKAIFNPAQYALSTAVATLILSRQGRLTSSGLTVEHAVFFGLAAVAFLLLNAVVVVGVISLAERKLYWTTLRRTISGTITFDVLGLPVIALLAQSYVSFGPVWVAAIAVPLLGLRQFYKQNADLEKLYEDTLKVMVSTIEMHDQYTSGHSLRVTQYSTLIAKLARLPAKTVDRINAAALLHDVGKAHPEYGPILKKPGRLTDEERRIIETHPVKSAEFVEKVRHLRDLVPAVRAHHERWDGHGYPDRLAGEAIPLGARVIALADTIDAMMSSRPYRDALQVSDIKREIERGRGTQFDPKLVDVLLADTSWKRLEKSIRRFQAMRPGDPVAWDESDRRETGDMPIIAVR